MLNLMAVLLRVADKFLDPHSPKVRRLMRLSRHARWG